MYIETKFYDNGKTCARIRNNINTGDTAETNCCDYYADEISNLRKWAEDNLSIKVSDIVQLVIDLKEGKWVNITNYC
jgi:hypothetical protein